MWSSWPRQSSSASAAGASAPVVQACGGSGGRGLRSASAPSQLGERLGQVPQRRFARQHGAGAPADAAAGVLLLELSQHAGADQRALAAAGIAMDHHQMLVEQARDDLVGHRLAAEEDRPLVPLERAQARIGRGRQLDLEEVRRRRAAASPITRPLHLRAGFDQPGPDLHRPVVDGRVDPVDAQVSWCS